MYAYLTDIDAAVGRPTELSETQSIVSSGKKITNQMLFNNINY